MLLAEALGGVGDAATGQFGAIGLEEADGGVGLIGGITLVAGAELIGAGLGNGEGNDVDIVGADAIRADRIGCGRTGFSAVEV